MPLSNDELQDKLAIYGAEVDWVARRQQSCDRIVENLIAKLWRLETRVEELEKTVEYLCMALTFVTVVAAVMFYLIA